MREKIQELRAMVRRGFPTRALLLAYALVRGKPYAVCELTVREGNDPPTYLLSELAGVELEEAKAWAKVPPTPEMLARAAAARQAFLDAKAQRRLRYLADRSGEARV